MTHDDSNLPARTQPPSQGPSSVLINELSACLTLVRPINMSDDAASDWIAVAASQLTDLAPHEVRNGARYARDVCEFHSQIVPAIRKANEGAIEYRRKMDALMWDKPTHSGMAIEYRGAKQIGHIKAIESHYITPEELAEMKAETSK